MDMARPEQCGQRERLENIAELRGREDFLLLCRSSQNPIKREKEDLA